MMRSLYKIVAWIVKLVARFIKLVALGVLVFLLGVLCIVLFLVLGQVFFAPEQLGEETAKAECQPVMAFLDARVAAHEPMPYNTDELQEAYQEATHSPLPTDVHGAAMGQDAYVLWVDISGGQTLWYVSKSKGFRQKGWNVTGFD